eukprot:COSAG02_NODE_58713_length_276_cov_0.932203_1_plen_75_part_00
MPELLTLFLMVLLRVLPARHVAAPGDTANAHGAKIALYYSGWQLVGQREDQPTAGDVNNVSRVAIPLDNHAHIP